MPANSATELYVEALQSDYEELYRKHVAAVGQLVFYKELYSITMARMFDSESERDKLRARLREVMGLDTDESKQTRETDGDQG